MGKKKSLPKAVAFALILGPFGLVYSLGWIRALVLILIWAILSPINTDSSNVTILIFFCLIPMGISIAGVIWHNKQVESKAEQENENSDVGTLPHRNTRTTRPFGTPTEPDSLSPDMGGISPARRLTAPRSQSFSGRSNPTYSYNEPPLDPYTKLDHSEAFHEADLGHDYDSPYHDIDLIDLDYDDLVPEGAEWRDPDDDPVDR